VSNVSIQDPVLTGAWADDQIHMTINVVRKDRSIKRNLVEVQIDVGIHPECGFTAG